MKVQLRIIAGPHQGREFTFDGQDTFLVGRVADAHLQLSFDDPYFSRRHFVIQINPPRCRLLDLKSRNGTLVNGKRVEVADLVDGDEIGAGHTVFQVRVLADDPDQQPTFDLPAVQSAITVDHQPGHLLVPGYRLGAELGRGGMGVVYRATRLADGQDVALKTFTPDPGATRRQIDRFLREAEILARLRHPNVVAFTEVGEAGPVLYLAMELVVGQDCDRLLAERGPMEIRLAVRLMAQVLKGLAHAHEAGYVHRDIKPSNILLATKEGNRRTPKLADFGLARAYESSKLSGLTLQGEIGGTPAYMAPEQVTHYREVKPTADQFSAAATLYRLLTNKYIHDLQPGIPRQLVQITTDRPIPIRERRPDLPAALAEVLDRALNREPKDRYPDVLAFREALVPFG